MPTTRRRVQVQPFVQYVLIVLAIEVKDERLYATIGVPCAPGKAWQTSWDVLAGSLVFDPEFRPKGEQVCRRFTENIGPPVRKRTG